MDIETLKHKQAEIRAQRVQFIAEAERQVAAFDGALALLETLIAEAAGEAEAGVATAAAAEIEA